jgi:hypothetical protein
VSTVSDISFSGPAGLIPVLPELTSTGTLRHVVLRPA